MSNLALMVGAALWLGTSSTVDPIDVALAKIRANPFFGNGLHEVIPLAANARSAEIIAAAYPKIRFLSQHSSQAIIEERAVDLYGQPSRIVVLRAATENIVCVLQHTRTGWTIDRVEE